MSAGLTEGNATDQESGSASALNADAIAAVDVNEYQVAYLQITGTFSGTLTLQGSNDNSNFVSVLATDISNPAQAPTSSISAPGLFYIPTPFRYFRVRMTSYSSGTASALAFFQRIISSELGSRIINQGTSPWATQDQADGPVSPGTVASKSILLGGQYRSTLPTLADGQQSAIQVDSNGRILVSSAVVSSLPAATFSKQDVIPNGVTLYTSFTATQKLAIKQFYAGGTGVGKQVLYSYLPNNTQLLNSGDFETAGDVANWPYFSNGGAGTGTVALSSAQAFTGTYSESVTFSSSDANHSNGIKQTFSSPIDISGWRYITAEFFNTLSSGGAYTRTISIVITDVNGSTRKFDVSGSSTVAPFNASNWIKITGEIANPTSATGSNFDVTSVASVELRMVDSANKTGTVYWDTARLESQIIPVFPIYHQANVSFNIAIDPVFVMNISDQILIAQTNNDNARQEYYAFAGGVAIT